MLATHVGLWLPRTWTYLQVQELILVCAPDVTVQKC